MGLCLRETFFKVLFLLTLYLCKGDLNDRTVHILIDVGSGEHANDFHPHASALGPDGLPRAQCLLSSPAILSRFDQLLWFFKHVEKTQG